MTVPYEKKVLVKEQSQLEFTPTSVKEIIKQYVQSIGYEVKDVSFRLGTDFGDGDQPNPGVTVFAGVSCQVEKK